MINLQAMKRPLRRKETFSFLLSTMLLLTFPTEAKEIESAKCLREGKLKLEAFITAVMEKSNYCSDSSDCVFYETELKHRLTINKKEASYAIACVDLAHEKYFSTCTKSSGINSNAVFSFSPLDYECVANKCVELKKAVTKRNWNEEYKKFPPNFKTPSAKCRSEVNKLDF